MAGTHCWSRRRQIVRERRCRYPQDGVDELELEHQVCKSYVKHNTETIIEKVEPKVESDEKGSLAATRITPEQALEDLKRLGKSILSRQPEEKDRLEEIHQRYTDAAPPVQGEKATVVYRLRLMYLDRRNLWRPLTRYRTWKGPKGERLDGTNNGCERAMGWWVKERHHTMQGYERRRSAVNVGRVLAWCGNHVGRGGADLALLAA